MALKGKCVLPLENFAGYSRILPSHSRDPLTSPATKNPAQISRERSSLVEIYFRSRQLAVKGTTLNEFASLSNGRSRLPGKVNFLLDPGRGRADGDCYGAPSVER